MTVGAVRQGGDQEKWVIGGGGGGKAELRIKGSRWLGTGEF